MQRLATAGWLFAVRGRVDDSAESSGPRSPSDGVPMDGALGQPPSCYSQPVGELSGAVNPIASIS